MYAVLLFLGSSLVGRRQEFLSLSLIVSNLVKYLALINLIGGEFSAEIFGELICMILNKHNMCCSLSR